MPPTESTIQNVRRERVLVLIIAYKFVKAALWLIFALVLVTTMHLGLGGHMVGFAAHLRHHSGAWSLKLAGLVTRAASPKGLWTITVALLADGTMTLFEGWALLHGRWWGPWLVVVATGSLLPFEVFALIRHPHVVRMMVLLVNAAIVYYLAQKAIRERRFNRLSSPDRQSA
jgi:uncharacterized membrane protein (DUF2068 family)